MWTRSTAGFVALVVLVPDIAQACTTMLRNIAYVGPTEWDGRDDIPTNWVFSRVLKNEGSRSTTLRRCVLVG